ncbi:MAG: methylenetetrahydrofolate reductase C-terminal domain-containing protein [Anaerolineales bacterium]|nr:methylenetetrahydrofolate reductase C-terminal domain-containing protein [Anaerolineales bacterium]MCB8990432.1 methylenetetrahydrofolate reductase C-terminal domain-containing protein [Ardenticatenaceae bacterium]MCB9003446.1 methylenetetrahydrofolate reductase C-terminal domain-containing protein [Ardenticatenaceae bacterium]
MMPIFTPGRRWQPPYYPFKKESLSNRALAAMERMVKGPLFGCRMCGNCLLQETAFICPMECPKGARNGPCGGSTEEHCYVDETRPCIWYKIYERAFKMGREEMLLEVLPPLDWDKVGGETWGDVVQQVKKIGAKSVAQGLMSRSPGERTATWDAIFRPVRQPDWWEGDAKYHPPAYEEPVSELERRLKAGEFVVTTEVAPPVTTATGKLCRNVQMVEPYVTAVNFTDCPSATPRMSSIACSKMALENGAEPVMQIAARDRTRTGLQAEVLGAHTMGIRNILCLSGDHSRMGPSPQGRMDVIDIDSIQMLWILRRMRDEGKYLDGRSIKFRPQFFLGAAGAPFASRPEYQAIREHKKVNAGAQFFQTNLVYDPDGMEVWLNELAKRNILDKVYILIGVTPLKNLKMAQYMHKDVPGVFVPDKVMKRMEAAGDGAEEEGVQIALEIIEAIKGKQGVNGIHLMAVGWEEIVPRIVTEAGLQRKEVAVEMAGNGTAVPA